MSKLKEEAVSIMMASDVSPFKQESIMMASGVSPFKSERKLFLPFIEELLDTEEVDGLHWIDKEQRIFRMPWKHMKRHDYDVDRDSALFRAWAVNSGKYKENDQDPSRWKINFRSALNTMKHIFQEIGENEEDDCRIFRIIPADGQSRKRKAPTPERLRGMLPIKPYPLNASGKPVWNRNVWDSMRVPVLRAGRSLLTLCLVAKHAHVVVSGRKPWPRKSGDSQREAATSRQA